MGQKVQAHAVFGPNLVIVRKTEGRKILKASNA